MPSPKREGHDAHEHEQYGNPAPTECCRDASDREEADPQDGDHELDWEKDQSEELNPTLFPAGQPDGEGGLAGVIDALAALDRPGDARPSVVVQAILEGKPPLGVASLLNHVHQA